MKTSNGHDVLWRINTIGYKTIEEFEDVHMYEIKSESKYRVSPIKNEKIIAGTDKALLLKNFGWILKSRISLLLYVYPDRNEEIDVPLIWVKN